jgi:hypothetical protein
MDDAERAELIAAVVQLTTAIEQILVLTERLLGMRPPVGLSAQEIDEARSQAVLWREQLDLPKARVASLTVQPPDRPQ